MKTFSLQIQSPDKIIFSGRASAVFARAADGEIGILPDHADLATRLVPGSLRYILQSGERVAVEGGEGFLIVKKSIDKSGSTVIILLRKGGEKE